ncbi:MAG: VOC family protein [Pseudomonadales bacterium]|nr:VOC family protein [Pseudomonadales bacterium]
MKARDPVFILYVHDMDRALKFYRDTFELEVVQHTQGWSMLRCGGATIALHILTRHSPESVLPHAGLNLQVDDLDAGIAAVIAAGGEHIETREPTSFVPVRMCELRDTEGNGFELRQFVAEGEDLTAVSHADA